MAIDPQDLVGVGRTLAQIGLLAALADIAQDLVGRRSGPAGKADEHQKYDGYPCHAGTMRDLPRFAPRFKDTDLKVTGASVTPSLAL